MPENLRARLAEAVFDDHLALAAEHRFDEGIVARTIHSTLEPINPH